MYTEKLRIFKNLIKFTMGHFTTSIIDYYGFWFQFLQFVFPQCIRYNKSAHEKPPFTCPYKHNQQI